MNKFIQHLKEKGYKVIEDKAILLDKTFKICSGYIDTAMGQQKSYWLELQVPIDVAFHLWSQNMLHKSNYCGNITYRKDVT